MSILTPKGFLTSTLPTYTVQQVLDAGAVGELAGSLHIPNSKYCVLYTLALNGCLDKSLTWVSQHQSLLVKLESAVPTATGWQLGPVVIAGPLSNMLTMFDGWTMKSTQPHPYKDFESSFHIQPTLFDTFSVSNSAEHREKLCQYIPPEITVESVRQTFNLVDDYYLSGLLKARLRAANKPLNFAVSDLMTSTAGKLSVEPEKFTLTMARKIETATEGRHANGIVARNAVEAFLLVLQHEIVHLIVHLEKVRLGIGYLDKPPGYESHGKVFRDIGHRLFGFTEIRHSLYGTGAVASAKASKEDFCLGKRIRFDYKGEMLFGNIVKLNPKKAVVKSDRGEFRVPYSQMTKS